MDRCAFLSFALFCFVLSLSRFRLCLLVLLLCLSVGVFVSAFVGISVSVAHMSSFPHRSWIFPTDHRTDGLSRLLSLLLSLSLCTTISIGHRTSNRPCTHPLPSQRLMASVAGVLLRRHAVAHAGRQLTGCCNQSSVRMFVGGSVHHPTETGPWAVLAVVLRTAPIGCCNRMTVAPCLIRTLVLWNATSSPVTVAVNRHCCCCSHKRATRPSRPSPWGLVPLRRRRQQHRCCHQIRPSHSCSTESPRFAEP